MIDWDDDELDLGRLMSAQDAERTLSIPASTVRSWYRRKGRTGLYDHGRDRRCHPLFWEADLLALRAGYVLRDQQGRRIFMTVS